MHLHGHTFWVVKTNEYDSGHGLLRDVVTVPAMGWALIRFVANNPGVWPLHCHIDWHMKAGFYSIVVEAPSKLQGTIDKIPADFKAGCDSFFKNLPSAAPVSGKPFRVTKTPISKKPTNAPISKKPTKAPVTKKPTKMPL